MYVLLFFNGLYVYLHLYTGCAINAHAHLLLLLSAAESCMHDLAVKCFSSLLHYTSSDKGKLLSKNDKYYSVAMRTRWFLFTLFLSCWWSDDDTDVLLHHAQNII